MTETRTDVHAIERRDPGQSVPEVEAWMARPLPLTPLELFLLNCQTLETPMVIRVVIRLRGTVDLAGLTDAFQEACGRHPLLCARLIRDRGRPAWRCGAPDPLQVAIAAGSMPVCGDSTPDVSIDLTRAAGLQTRVTAYSDGVVICLDGHHAVADGGGLRQLGTEWLVLYHNRITGDAIKMPAMEPERLQRRDQFPLPSGVAPIGFRDALRNFLVTIRGRTSRWPRLSSPRPGDSAGRSDATSRTGVFAAERLISDDAGAAFRRRMSDQSNSLNDFLLAACMSACAALIPPGADNDRITVMNPVDLRLPSDRCTPAANRFGFAFLRRRRSECGPGASPSQLRVLQDSLRDEMTYVRKNRIGVEFLHGLAKASRFPGGVRLIRGLGFFVPTAQWTCLGDVTRSTRRTSMWQNEQVCAGGAVMESISGFAPCAPGVPITVAGCEAGKRISLTVCGSPQYVSQSVVNTFADLLVSSIHGEPDVH